MTSVGMVRLRDIQRMLKKCAPGHEWILKDHAIHVVFRGRAFRTLPKGGHDSKREVKLGYARKLVQHLQIPLACAEEHLPSIAR